MKRNREVKRIFAVLLAMVMVLTMVPSLALAAGSDIQAPKMLSGSISSRVLAYEGNAVPGYLTAVVKTDEPTRGYIDVIGNESSTKIELDPWTSDYSAEHEVNWAPWDEEKKKPLTPGEYTLKLYLNDEASNKTGAIDMGKITVVAEPNPKPLVENITFSAAVISPSYNDSYSPVTIRFTLNRHASLKTILRSGGRDGTDRFSTEGQMLEPGVHEITWDGKDENGMIVPRGMYYVVFKGYELNYNHPTGYPQEYWTNSKFMVDSQDSGVPKERLQQIVTHAELDRPVISPNGDGIQDMVQGKITLAEDVTHLAVYMADSMGYNATQPLFAKDNAKVGTYSFTWDGKDFAGFAPYNGMYYVNVYVSQDDYRYYKGLLMEDAGVLLTDGMQISVPQPVQKVKVSTDSVLISLDPTGSGYTAYKGQVFTVLGYDPQRAEPRGAYKILIKDGVVAHIPAVYVEMADLDNIPERWGTTVKEEVEVREGPMEHYGVTDRLPEGTQLRILRQDGDFYRILLPSGQQAFVAAEDLEAGEESSGPEITIKDIDSSADYAKQSIINLNKRNIISGNENGHFNPRNAVSRAEMIKMLVNSLNIDTGNVPENATFKDVPRDHWAYSYVEAAYREGIVKGLSSDQFGTDKVCTREEIATMFVRSLGISDDSLAGKLEPENVNSLNDKDKISDWAKDYVEFAMSTGLMKGSGVKIFDAKGRAERQQAAVVIDRFTESKQTILEFAKAFTK